MIDINEIIGFAGLSLILIAFILNLLKKMKTESRAYNTINLVGALMLAYYSWIINSIPFFILQTMWGISALYNLAR